MTLPPTDIDLHDTHLCPCGTRCGSCGYTTAQPTVTTVSTPVGVFCRTVCPACLASGNAPHIPVSSAVRLVLSHCLHLGIDSDQMAAILADEAATR